MVRRLPVLCLALLLVVSIVVVERSTGAPRARVAVALVKSRDLPPYREAAAGLKEGLEAAGLNPFIATYDLDGKASMAGEIAAALRQSPPDLVVTQGSLATRELARAVPGVPIVFCMVLEPEGSGVLPGGERKNLTGVSMDVDPGAQIDAIRQVLPGAKRVGVIYRPAESGQTVEKARAAAGARGLELVAEAIAAEKDVSRALRSISARVDVLMAVPDTTVYTESSTRYILLHTLREALPFMGLLEAFVEGGALMGVGLDYRDLGRQAGEAAARIAAGEAAGRIPIAAPRRTKLLLNLRTARRIGVEIPAAVRTRAEVVVP